MRLERPRRFGDCFLGLESWRRLALDHFSASVLDRFEAPVDVLWSRIVALLAINRLCTPGSELATEAHWYPTTALDDLLHFKPGKINDTRLHRCLDRLIPHKTKCDRHLAERYGELFARRYGVLLHDPAEWPSFSIR